MVLRIWRTRIDESRADDYREFAERESLPMFSAQPGFLGLLFGATPGERVVATIWESHEATARLEEAQSYRDTVAAIQATGFLVGESDVEILELQRAFLTDQLLDTWPRTR